MSEQDPKRKPSVKSLAKATGFSVATISRVLNGSDTVAQGTRERVLEAMRKAGYLPNSAARALATNRTKTIGAVVPIVSQSIFSRFLDSLEVELAAHGYVLVIATTGFDPAIETQRATELLTMGAEGLIFSGAKQQPELLELIKNTGTPAICSSIHKSTNGLPAIGYDNEALAYSAIQYLAQLGHSKIGIVHGPIENNDRTELRITGVEKAVMDYKIDASYYPTELSVQGGVNVARQLFQKPLNISSILCLSDILALGMMFESIAKGIQIPRDISLMGFDNLDWANLCHPTLTTTRLPTKRMGQEIALSLVNKLDKQQAITSMLLDAELLERQSTAACK